MEFVSMTSLINAIRFCRSRMLLFISESSITCQVNMYLVCACQGNTALLTFLLCSFSFTPSFPSPPLYLTLSSQSSSYLSLHLSLFLSFSLSLSLSLSLYLSLFLSLCVRHFSLISTFRIHNLHAMSLSQLAIHIVLQTFLK